MAESKALESLDSARLVLTHALLLVFGKALYKIFEAMLLESSLSSFHIARLVCGCGGVCGVGFSCGVCGVCGDLPALNLSG